jgi:argininosuccinate lyase
VESCLEVIGQLLGEISFNGERLKKSAEEGFLVATDLADYLVGRGITFREAHEIVGKMVLFALEQEKELHELTLDEMNRFTRQIKQDVYEWLEPASSLDRRNLPGGTGPVAVKKSIEKAKQELKL